MVVTIEKYFEIYVVPNNVSEYKNNVKTFRNIQCLMDSFIMLFLVYAPW